jgi:hypothetical protein
VRWPKYRAQKRQLQSTKRNASRFPPQIDRYSGSAFSADQPYFCAETIPPGDLGRQLETLGEKTTQTKI